MSAVKGAMRTDSGPLDCITSASAWLWLTKMDHCAEEARPHCTWHHHRLCGSHHEIMLQLVMGSKIAALVRCGRFVCGQRRKASIVT